MKNNKKYIISYRCRKCGEEFEDGFNDPYLLLSSYNIKHTGHNCPKRVSKDEVILMDVLAYRPNLNYTE